MPTQVYSNTYISRITADITSSDLEINVISMIGLASIGNGFEQRLILQQAGNIEDITAIKAISGVLTVKRAQRGTTAQSFTAGAVISLPNTYSAFVGSGGSGGMSDGNYGDITISSSATILTINTPGLVSVTSDDKVLIKDTSDSDNTKYVTAQDIANLSSSSITQTEILSRVSLRI